MKIFRILFLVNAAFFLVFIVGQFSSKVWANEQLIFSDDFEKGLGGWKVEGTGISIVQLDGGPALEIVRENEFGFSYVAKKFSGVKGTLRFEAIIRPEKVTVGNKDYFRGKFQAVIIVNGKEVAFPDDDFDGSSPPMKKSFTVRGLSGSEIVILRIGLQNSMGKVWVRQVRAYLEE